jgi:hypothetical protein
MARKAHRRAGLTRRPHHHGDSSHASRKHRDTQAIHAKLDELLRLEGQARNELTHRKQSWYSILLRPRYCQSAVHSELHRHDLAVRESDGRGQALRLPGEASFALEKAAMARVIHEEPAFSRPRAVRRPAFSSLLPPAPALKR